MLRVVAAAHARCARAVLSPAVKTHLWRSLSASAGARSLRPALPRSLALVTRRALSSQSGDQATEPLDRMLEEITTRIAGLDNVPSLRDGAKLAPDELVDRYPPKYTAMLAMALYAGAGVEEDQEKAIELWRLLHDRDLSDDASYSYAMCLVQGGTSAPHDPERGLQTLHLLASRKFAYACHALGFMYEAGEGVEQDVAKAKEMYSAAAESGLSAACSMMGDLLLKNNDDGQGAEEITAWYKRGAEAGDVASMYNYSVRLAEGLGVEPDEARSTKWLQAAVSRRYPPAMHNMGLMHAELRSGVDEERAPIEAARLIRAAAAMGFSPSMIRVAQFYASGYGVEQSLPEAVFWLKAAQEAGVPGLDEALGSLTAAMEEEEQQQQGAGQGVGASAQAARLSARGDAQERRPGGGDGEGAH